MFRWWKESKINTQPYRLRLDAIVGDLRMALADVSEPLLQQELSEELRRLEEEYRAEIRNAHHRSL